jgi:hypothetical protein
VGVNSTDKVFINEMTSRIEQDNEQYPLFAPYPPFALILPRGAAYAPLPQATKAGAYRAEDDLA